jgi:hypothetical protein
MNPWITNQRRLGKLFKKKFPGALTRSFPRMNAGAPTAVKIFPPGLGFVLSPLLQNPELNHLGRGEREVIQLAEEQRRRCS